MRQKLYSSTSETYKLKMTTFENEQPEDFLMLMNNFKTAIEGTGTISVAGRINYLHTMLRGEALKEFDKFVSQNNGTTNAHLNHIQEVLLGYFT